MIKPIAKNPIIPCMRVIEWIILSVTRNFLYGLSLDVCLSFCLIFTYDITFKIYELLNLRMVESYQYGKTNGISLTVPQMLKYLPKLLKIE